MDKKHQVLSQYFGYASFRSGQEELIDAQLAGRDAFGVMPTGGGKSLCYQIPALLLEGITLVVCPLISLMKDQVAALKKVGVPAAYINSSLSAGQIRMVYRNLLAQRYKIVYIAPERLLTEEFLWTVQQCRVSLLAVDEAHCISQWGQDFRPSYLKIVEFLNRLAPRPVVSAFTATATPRVREDVERILDLQDPLRVVTGFDRPNLRFEVVKPKRKPNLLLTLIENRAGKSGIVYCSTRRQVEQSCQMLQENGIAATRYHAGLQEEEKRTNQDDFIFDRCSVMVATNAFGMGIDKSNVSYVIHYNMPQSMEAYYQEAGRAGRDGSHAECILLYSAADVRTANYLIENSAPDGEISESQRKQITEQELFRLDKMIGYCNTTECLRGYILEYFGEPHKAACGNCGNCDTTFTEADITTQAKMILSCVKRIENHLGCPASATCLVRVLRGSSDKRLLQAGLDTISTYGLMRTVARADIREWIGYLEIQGYLYTNPETKTVTLTPQAGEILFHGKTIAMPVRPAPRQERKTICDPEMDEELFASLKALRSHVAAREKVPAYIVFSNATLQDMARKKPATMEEFLNVSGVGAHKARQYGELFLAEIRMGLSRSK